MKGHIHELTLSVHLETALDVLVNIVFNCELLILVVGVCLQGRDDLTLLDCGKSLG